MPPHPPHPHTKSFLGSRRLILKLVVKERTLRGGGREPLPSWSWLDLDGNRHLGPPLGVNRPRPPPPQPLISTLSLITKAPASPCPGFKICNIFVCNCSRPKFCIPYIANRPATAGSAPLPLPQNLHTFHRRSPRYGGLWTHDLKALACTSFHDFGNFPSTKSIIEIARHAACRSLMDHEVQL